MKKVNDVINVYWSNYANSSSQQMYNLMEINPQPLLPELKNNYHRQDDDKKANYQYCPALTGITRNSFFAKFPFDASVIVDEMGNGVQGEKKNWFIGREKSYSDRINTDLDIGWFFFADQPLNMEVTPPYFHNTIAGKSGLMTAGSFDIGQWFRQVQLSYILWENNMQFICKRGEPAIYFNFKTDKKIVLHQFNANDELRNAAFACANLPRATEKFKSLKSLYEIFNKTKTNNFVLKNIKENLVI
jgi:hypothetical protein